MESKNIRLNVQYGCLQGSYWILAAISSAFLTPLLKVMGFSYTEIGTIIAVKYLSAIVAQVFYSWFADKYADRFQLKNIIGVIALASLVATVFFMKCPLGYGGTVVLFAVFGATLNCIQPLVDSLSARYANDGKDVHYNIARGVGSLTWALTCAYSGTFADRYGTENILYLQIGAVFLVMVLAFSMMRIQGKQEKEEKRGSFENTGEGVHSFGYLFLKFPKYRTFLFSAAFGIMCFNFSSTFLIDLIENLGGTNVHYGISEFVLAIAEIPTALCFLKLRKRFSIDQLLLCCMFFNMLKALAMTWAPNVVLLIASMLFEMLGMGLYYASLVYFVMENLPAGDVVKGVTLVNVAANGVGASISTYFSGVILEAFGMRALMYTGVFMGIISTLLIAKNIVSDKGTVKRAVEGI